MEKETPFCRVRFHEELSAAQTERKKFRPLLIASLICMVLLPSLFNFILAWNPLFIFVFFLFSQSSMEYNQLPEEVKRDLKAYSDSFK